MRTRFAVLTLLAAITAASIATADGRISFIWKRGANDSVTMSGDLDDLKLLKNNEWGNEFIWTRQANGAQYVITDRSVLNEVAAAHAELDRVEAPMRELEERMRPHEEEMEKVEERMDAVSDKLGDETLSESERRELERRMDAISDEMDRISDRMESVSEEMERRSDIIEREAEKAEKELNRIVARAIREGKAKRVH